MTLVRLTFNEFICTFYVYCDMSTEKLNAAVFAYAYTPLPLTPTWKTGLKIWPFPLSITLENEGWVIF